MKQFNFRHLIALILMMCGMMGRAQIFEVGSLMYYSTDSNQRCVEVVAPLGDIEYLEVIDIPSSITKDGVEYTVNKVGEKAFYECKNLTSVTIPGSVTSIGKDAFSYCSRLTSITIPSSVTCIGMDAFKGCSNLTSITSPSSVISIGESAFWGCKSLTSITIPHSVTSIGEYAFWGCKSLRSITIPSSVVSIGDGAFYDCKSLTSITIPNSVTSIGYEVFRSCSSLTSITIPNSVTSIGYDAFYDCKSLTSINIPSSVTYIGMDAFKGCSNLTSITIPSSVISIGESAFSKCEKLRVIVLPEHITNIDKLNIPYQARIIRNAKADHSLGNNASDEKVEKEEVVDNAIVEVQAEFPGGESAILTHVAKNLHYPEIALEQELQGTVVVRFEVKKDGTVGRTQVVKSLSAECDLEACKVIKIMPRFTPARRQGRPVAVWFTFPVRFQIQ